MTFSGERLDAVVAEAVAGNRNALREVLEIIRPIVVRYCRARVGATERSGLSADDVAQEVCLAAITALPRYKDQGRPFLAFVYGIAAHKVADAHRAAARNRSDPTDIVPERFSMDAGPEQMARDHESSARLNDLCWPWFRYSLLWSLWEIVW
jgi:RNA polymerase sigma-70 factor (ECF subfamily)